MCSEFMKEQKTIVPTVYEQQIILSCKGHSKNKNTIEAIRNIIAQQCNLKITDVDDNSIYYWMIKNVRKYANFRTIDDFVDNLFQRKNTITLQDAISSLVSILASIEVFDKDGNELIYLEPDRKILDYAE